jgi:hypothetical protein
LTYVYSSRHSVLDAKGTLYLINYTVRPLYEWIRIERMVTARRMFLSFHTTIIASCHLDGKILHCYQHTCIIDTRMAQ